MLIGLVTICLRGRLKPPIDRRRDSLNSNLVSKRENRGEAFMRPVSLLFRQVISVHVIESIPDHYNDLGRGSA